MPPSSTPAASDAVWYTRCTIPTAFSIAVERGLLADELAGEIELRSLVSTPDRAFRDVHFTHDHPRFFRQGGNIPPIAARSRGVDVRVIGLSWTDIRYPVLTLPDSGIETAADLVGRRLALPRRPNIPVDFWRATALRTYDQILRSVGATLDDVELVDVENSRPFVDEGRREQLSGNDSLWGAHTVASLQRDEALALVRGEVDGIASEGQASSALIPYFGLRTVADLFDLEDPAARVNNSVPAPLTVSGALLDERPDVVERVLLRVLDASRWAAGHELEASRLVARELGLHEEFLGLGYPSVHGQLDLDLSDERVAGLRSQHDFLLEHGFIDQPVDFGEFIAHAPIDAVNSLLTR
jgi:ABC-type nitrate/sulfonate/bicarbonate transport system substrate-binding protein